MTDYSKYISKGTPADPEQVGKVAEALKKRGINVIFMQNRKDALEKIKEIIPEGAGVMTGASITLQQIGFEEYLISGKHRWKNIKDGILAEKDPVRQSVLRKQSTLSDYFLGSVHAITEAGEIVIASATGSQIPAYAFSSNNIIWIAGTQKIVASLQDALNRIREYIFPLEDLHMKDLYGQQAGSLIGKILIFEHESPIIKRNINMILVNEALGF